MPLILLAIFVHHPDHYSLYDTQSTKMDEYLCPTDGLDHGGLGIHIALLDLSTIESYEKVIRI